MVSFLNCTGKQFKVTVPVTDRQNIGLGSAVSLVYNPLEPEEAYLADRWQVGLGAVALMGFGLLFSTMGLWMLFKI